MSKVFVEYAIKSECRNAYLIYMQGLQQREGHMELLEGTDQEGLYVEIWHEVTYEAYVNMKEERLQVKVNGDLQGNWEEWIQGGIKKLHMWHFSPVSAV